MNGDGPTAGIDANTLSLPGEHEPSVDLNCHYQLSCMNKPISRPLHGLLTDYPYVLIVGTAPFRLQFRDQHTPATLCFVLAGLILLTRLVTRAEWGLVRIVPYKLHLVADVVVGLFALLSPFLLGFSHDATSRNTLIVFGLFGILAGTLSQTTEMRRDEVPRV